MENISQKDISKDMNEQRAIPCSWIDKYYKILIKNPNSILKKLDKWILKFVWKKIVKMLYEKKKRWGNCPMDTYNKQLFSEQ